jgi:succinate dehydrogenase hydrophobic membrane anchor protein
MCVWLVLNIVGLIGAPYEVFIAWLTAPVNAALMIIFILVIFYHAMLGIHEILEDYVHAPGHPQSLDDSSNASPSFFSAQSASIQS